MGGESFKWRLLDGSMLGLFSSHSVVLPYLISFMPMAWLLLHRWLLNSHLQPRSLLGIADLYLQKQPFSMNKKSTKPTISFKPRLPLFPVTANGTIIHSFGNLRSLGFNLDPLFSITTYLTCQQFLPILPPQIYTKLIHVSCSLWPPH